MKKLIALIVIISTLFSVTLPSFAIYFGDIDDDGNINSIDALSVLQFSVNRITLSEDQKIKADMDDNGEINSSDALIILLNSIGNLEYLKPKSVKYYSISGIINDNGSDYVISEHTNQNCTGAVSIINNQVYYGVYEKTITVIGYAFDNAEADWNISSCWTMNKDGSGKKKLFDFIGLGFVVYENNDYIYYMDDPEPDYYTGDPGESLYCYNKNNGTRQIIKSNLGGNGPFIYNEKIYVLSNIGNSMSEINTRDNTFNIIIEPDCSNGFCFDNSYYYNSFKDGKWKKLNLDSKKYEPIGPLLSSYLENINNDYYSRLYDNGQCTGSQTVNGEEIITGKCINDNDPFIFSRSDGISLLAYGTLAREFNVNNIEYISFIDKDSFTFSVPIRRLDKLTSYMIYLYDGTNNEITTLVDCKEYINENTHGFFVSNGTVYRLDRKFKNLSRLYMNCKKCTSVNVPKSDDIS